LIEIIKNLEEYDTGKEKLIAARREHAAEWEIQMLIDSNRQRKDRCLELIETINNSIRNTIKGQK
jgi:primosomal protein N''